jgi:hypothetical protein
MMFWREVTSKSKLRLFANQISKSVGQDLTRLNQSQKDMLTAIAIEHMQVNVPEALKFFNTAKSSVGFARRILIACDYRIAALILSGKISIHVLDPMRRKMGAGQLLVHFTSMTDGEIAKKYVRSPIGMNRVRPFTRNSKKTVETPTPVEPTPPTLTPRQLAAQKASRARWDKVKAAKVEPNETDVPIHVDQIELTRNLHMLTSALGKIMIGDMAGARKWVDQAKESLATI